MNWTLGENKPNQSQSAIGGQVSNVALIKWVIMNEHS
jgi:hypothetical protein